MTTDDPKDAGDVGLRDPWVPLSAWAMTLAPPELATRWRAVGEAFDRLPPRPRGVPLSAMPEEYIDAEQAILVELVDVRERLHAALMRGLQAGELIARGRLDPVERGWTEFPPSAWQFLVVLAPEKFDGPLYSNSVCVNNRVRLADPADTRIWHDVQVWRLSDRVIESVAPAAIAPDPAELHGARATSASLAPSKYDSAPAFHATEYLMAKFKKGERQTKAKIMKELLEKFPGLSKESFLRIWERLSRSFTDIRRPGRRSSKQIKWGNPESLP